MDLPYTLASKKIDPPTFFRKKVSHGFLLQSIDIFYVDNEKMQLWGCKKPKNLAWYGIFYIKMCYDNETITFGKINDFTLSGKIYVF